MYSPPISNVGMIPGSGVLPGWNFKAVKPLYNNTSPSTNGQPKPKQQTGCVCDIQVLLAGGCQCGYIEIERRNNIAKE